MRPDLALLLHSFEMGGAQKRTLALAAELARRGRRVDLVVVRGEGPLRAALDPAVRLVTLEKRPPSARGLAMAAAIPALAAYIRRERPAVLVSAANHSALAAITGHTLAGVATTALVLRVSNPLMVGRDRPQDRVRRLLLRRLMRRVDGFACVSEQIRGEVLALDPRAADRARVVVNPVAPAPQDVPSPPPRSRPGPELLGLGRLNPQKGFDVLIRAFARLDPALGARLTIVGGGPERPALERLAEEMKLGDRVVFAGETARPLEALVACDLFVLSSRFEGMPGALIEAMACGRAVVATDLPSVRELVEGLPIPLAPPGDAEALAAAMARALAVPQDPAPLRVRAARYAIAAATDDFEALLDTAAKRRVSRLSGPTGSRGRAAPGPGERG